MQSIVFQEEFPDSTILNPPIVRDIVEALRKTGFLIDNKYQPRCRVLIEESSDDIGARLENLQRKSLGGLAQEVGVSKSSAKVAI